jgi:peptidoglycan/LPS O-acetylase OafA/YrhL
MNFGLDAGETGAFSHAWSLCIEEHFYLVLPIVVLWFMRSPSLARACKVSAAIVFGGLVLRGALWIQYIGPLRETGWPGLIYLKDIYYPTYNRLDGLLAGVLLAAVRIFKPGTWARFTGNGNVALGLGLAVLSAALWICQDMTSFWTATIGYPLLALGFALLVVASMSGSSLIGKYRVPGTTLGATLAFGTYLTHKEVMHLDRLYLSTRVSLAGWQGLAVYLVSFLLVAVVLHLLVERPFLRLRDSLLGTMLRTLPLKV